MSDDSSRGFGDARRRVERDRERVERRRRAYERFRSRVESVSVGSRNSQATGTGTVSTVTLQETPEGGCRQVREAYARTIHRCSDNDEKSVLEGIRSELGERLALVLSEQSTHRLTPRVRDGLLSRLEDRRERLAAMERGLKREGDSLRAADEVLESVRAWVERDCKRPPLQLDFPTLRERHERLGDHRDSCERLLMDRQETLQGTTGHEARVGLTHRSLVESLYEELEHSYPVLARVTRLERALSERQRTVRRHLARRV